jgi:hypothetical protein
VHYLVSKQPLEVITYNIIIIIIVQSFRHNEVVLDPSNVVAYVVVNNWNVCSILSNMRVGWVAVKNTSSRV